MSRTLRRTPRRADAPIVITDSPTPFKKTPKRPILASPYYQEDDGLGQDDEQPTPAHPTRSVIALSTPRPVKKKSRIMADLGEDEDEDDKENGTRQRMMRISSTPDSPPLFPIPPLFSPGIFDGGRSKVSERVGPRRSFWMGAFMPSFLFF